MRNLLALAALAVLTFLGLGWYLGWYKVESTPTADGHRQIQVDLNTNKIKSDVTKGENKVHDLLIQKDGTTNATTTSFQPESGTFVFPGNGSSSGAPLPPPR